MNNNSRFTELREKKQNKIDFSPTEQAEYESYTGRLEQADQKRTQFNNKVIQDVHDQALAERGNDVRRAVQNEVRTGVEASQKGVNNNKIIKFKAPELDSIAEDITDSTNRELTELYQQPLSLNPAF